MILCVRYNQVQRTSFLQLHQSIPLQLMKISLETFRQNALHCGLDSFLSHRYTHKIVTSENTFVYTLLSNRTRGMCNISIGDFSKRSQNFTFVRYDFSNTIDFYTIRFFKCLFYFILWLMSTDYRYACPKKLYIAKSLLPSPILDHMNSTVNSPNSPTILYRSIIKISDFVNPKYIYYLITLFWKSPVAQLRGHVKK